VPVSVTVFEKKEAGQKCPDARRPEKKEVRKVGSYEVRSG
jgi:hypothetical protein